MVHDPRDRSPYRSPDAVLAEAQRIAADIRRRAEREANAIRREAAEWASTTRQDADRYRERVLAELEHARAVAAVEQPRPAPAPEPEADPTIDLRSPTELRPVRLVIVPPTDTDTDPDPDDLHLDEPTVDTEADADVEVDEVVEVVEAHHRPAVGGTYVVGHHLPAPGTSIESKVHDVVRLAVRRTFHRRFP